MRYWCLALLVWAGCGGAASDSSRSPTLTVTIEALSASPLVGEPFAVQVTVLHFGGPVAQNYRGTVWFGTDAPAAQLPAPYTFTESDRGSRRFPGISFDVGGGYVLYVLGDDLEGEGTLPLLIGSVAPTAPLPDPPTGEVVLVKDAAPITTNARTPWMALEDFDGDGDLDLLTAPFGGRPKRLHRNDGRGAFDAGPDLTRDSWIDLATGDVDNDGDIDLIIVREAAEQGKVWLNDGNGVFTERDDVVGDRRARVAAGDLDGDGAADLVRASHSSLDVWMNDPSPEPRARCTAAR